MSDVTMRDRGSNEYTISVDEAYLLEYDEFVDSLWIDSELPEHDVIRCALALSEEAGEAAGKLKKKLRGDSMDESMFAWNTAQELGDVLFYVAKYAHLLGYTLADIARLNTVKLSDRKERGVVKGSGDAR